MNINPLLLAGIAALMLLALILLVSFRRNNKIRVFWALLAVLCSGGAMLLCALGLSAGTVYAKPSGDPLETVNQFFSSVVSEDYAAAYALLKDHADLGLANEPSSEAAKLINKALKDSYDYKLVGNCEVNMLSATQRVSMRYLDIGSATSGLEKATENQLKTIVQDRSHSQVYDENDQYLPAVTEEAYLKALTAALRQASKHYTEIEFDVQLVYSRGKWLLNTAPELLIALSGGTGL